MVDRLNSNSMPTDKKRLRARTVNVVIVVVALLTIFSIGFDTLEIRVVAPSGSVTTKAPILPVPVPVTVPVPLTSSSNSSSNSEASSDLWNTNTTTKAQDKASKSGAETVTENAETEIETVTEKAQTNNKTAAPENEGTAGERKSIVGGEGGGESEQTQTQTQTSTSSHDGSADAEEAEIDAEPVITLLVMLSGEFGNNMFKIIRGWGTATLAWEEFGLSTRLVFAQQSNGQGGLMRKAVTTSKMLRQCIMSPSYFRTGDFGLGNKLLNKGYFHELQIPDTNFTLSDNEATIDTIRANLKILSDYLGEHPELLNNSKNNNATATQTQPMIPKIMVRVNSLNVYPIVNEFYDTIRKTFVFDDEQCCKETLKDPPAEDETVLHLRNYVTEMGKFSRRQELGFEELDEGFLTSEVLGHLKEGDKIALAGRNFEKDSKTNITQAYRLVSAIRAKNLTVRFTTGSDPMTDFCFLKSARKELIGSSKSTYLELAAYLGGPSVTTVLMYQNVTSRPSRGTRLDLFRSTVGSNWTHPELRARIRIEEYV